HMECLVRWQELRAPAGNILMCSILSAIGHMKAFIADTYTLLESTIAFYFRSSQDSLDWHSPSWLNLFVLLQMSLEKLDLMPIMRSSCMFTLHVFILYKMEKITSAGDRITFLQDLSQLIESLKTEPSTEPIMAIVWGAMISWGCRIMPPFAIIMQHHLESGGDGILGAIGFKKEVVTNRRKVLTRCLALVIFSLFPYKSTTGENVVPCEDYSSSMRELSMLLANKKFMDVKPLIVQSIGILNENPTPPLHAVSHHLSANWTRQLVNSVNGKVLYPWREQQADSSRIIIKNFIRTLIFVLENLPICLYNTVSHKILSHTFSWYIHHFGVPNIEHYIYGPIHEGIAELHWEPFKPQNEYIDMLYDSLQKPNIHIHVNTSNILEDAIKYPWYMAEYTELENLWFVTTVVPVIILKMLTETYYADRAVLDLIRLTCAMMPERSDQTKNISSYCRKRILIHQNHERLQRLVR
ncbi:hypothetical protein DOY81_013025, partial [Sarcophaga bullata]